MKAILMNGAITNVKVTTIIAERLKIEWAELTPITISRRDGNP